MSDADKALDVLLDAIKTWGKHEKEHGTDAAETRKAWVSMIDALVGYGREREAEGAELAKDPYGM